MQPYCPIIELKTHLKGHIEAVHEKILYSCDLCEFSAIKKGYIGMHYKKAHKGIPYNSKNIRAQNKQLK